MSIKKTIFRNKIFTFQESAFLYKINRNRIKTFSFHGIFSKKFLHRKERSLLDQRNISASFQNLPWICILKSGFSKRYDNDISKLPRSNNHTQT